MTVLAYRPKLGSELEFVGQLADIGKRRVQVVKFDAWYEDTYRPDAPVVLMGRNGRPRNRITLPGHGAGVKPPNTGLTYPADPPTPEEMLRLIAACPNTKAGVRNRALIALLWRTGLRINEALDLRPHHVDFGARRVTVLHGKGDKRRTVGIDDGGLLAVQPWLIVRQIILAAVPERAATAPLFCTLQLPGRGGRMHDAYVRTVLHKYGALAGGLGATTHDLCQPDVGGLRFGGRIHELRELGYVIEARPARAGSYRYTLRASERRAA